MNGQSEQNKITLADISEDELQMALCAVRYCIGRQTYIVTDGIRWATHYGRRSRWFRDVLICDLEAAGKRCDASNEAAALGGPSDELDWRATLQKLRAMRDAKS